MNKFLDLVVEFLTTAGVRLVIAIALLFIGWKLLGKLTGIISNAKKLQSIDKTARVFISNFANIGLKIILVIICVSILGVDMTSVVAILTTAAAAIGLALQGGLSNIAGGIIILIFKPFKIGDYITCGAEGGTVIDINMFYTVVRTPDNKIINMPNATVSNSSTTNYSQEELRRVDIALTVDFDANVEGVQALLRKIGSSNELVLTDPAPDAFIVNYGEKGIDLQLRVWTRGADYWTVFFALNEAIKAGFEQYDVKFALPKVQVSKD